MEQEVGDRELEATPNDDSGLLFLGVISRSLMCLRQESGQLLGNNL